MSNKGSYLTWVEINKQALIENIQTIRGVVGPQVIMAPAVKGNAYGHGLVETAQIISSAGANWLSVNALFEAQALRQAKIKCPIYILGYVMKSDIRRAVELDCRLVVYNRETIDEISRSALSLKKTAKVHIKVETGTTRQGVYGENVVEFARYVQGKKGIVVEGVATHFANLEDRINTEYADFQLGRFNDALKKLEEAGITIPIRHCANSAATLLLPQTHMEMIRPGIVVYGLWPSEKTRVSLKKFNRSVSLNPVLSFKTRIAQIKSVPKGAFVGYGCTYKTTRPSKLALLPTGYYDGYDRSGFSNKSYVLIRGKRAPVRGRIHMNTTMVDVTDIPDAQLEDIVTLIGKDGQQEITADFLAEQCGTINYEITTRINERIPRVVV